jgi:hypothetical protein
MSGEVVGWVITPDEIKGRMVALDILIRELSAAVTSSQAPRIDARYRAAFAGFERRWFEFYSAYTSWSPRLFARRWEPRYLDFVKAYDTWSATYEARKLPAEKVAQPATPAMRDLSDDALDAAERAAKGISGAVRDILEPVSGAMTVTSWAVLLVAGLGAVVWLRK